MASVRAATAEDAVACVAIVAGLPDFFTDDVPDKVRSDLRDHSGWVLDDAGGVVGFAIVERRGMRAAGSCGPRSPPSAEEQGADPAHRPRLGRVER